MAQEWEEIPPLPSPIPRQRPVKSICDMCGKTAGHGGYLPEWMVGDSSVPHRELNQIISNWGFTYVEVATKIDLCPQCFHEKLVPWLKEQGVDVEKRTRRQGGCGMERGW